MLAEGQRIDRYVVEAELGAGGVATVYRVRHTLLGSRHALKVLHLHGRDIGERLVQEGKLQSKLHHPNIVRVTDIVVADGAPGVVMEYIEGPSLDRWLRAYRPTPTEAEALFRGILAGVGFAHKNGLVHRDLKPGNVLLEVTDEGLVPKVADFGLAKVLMEADGSASNSNTRSGVAMGTPAYMAPEQVRDSKSVDQRADIFALGCILYELFVGRSPFDAPDVLSIFSALAAGVYEPPEIANPDTPPRVRAAIDGCLRGDRAERIPDCATLRAVLDGVPVSGPRASSPAISVGGSAALASGPTVAPPSRVSSETWVDPAPRVVSAASLAAAREAGSPRAAPTIASTPSMVAPGAPPPLPPRPRTGLWSGWWVVGGGLLLLFGLLGVIAIAMIVGGLSQGVGSGGPRDPVASSAEPPPVQAAPPPVEPPAPGDEPRSVATTEPVGGTGDTPAATGGSVGAAGGGASTLPPEYSTGGTTGTSLSGKGSSTGTPEVISSTATTAKPPESTTTKPPETTAAKPPEPTAAKPPEPTGERGTVVLTGDATEVWLEGAAGRFRPGAVPAGEYRVKARFGEGELIAAGRVTVAAGQTVTLACQGEFQICRAR